MVVGGVVELGWRACGSDVVSKASVVGLCRSRQARPGLAHHWAVTRGPDGGCAGCAVVVAVEMVGAVVVCCGGERKEASNRK